jgi:hypothetical protein
MKLKIIVFVNFYVAFVVARVVTGIQRKKMKNQQKNAALFLAVVSHYFKLIVVRFYV